MQNCQLCQRAPINNYLTKCCQLFICLDCKDRAEKQGLCMCQRPVLKKTWCEPEPRLFDILQNYYNSKPLECDRCDTTTDLCYCLQCKFYYCQDCHQDVHSIGAYLDHRVVERGEEGFTSKVLQEKKRQSNLINPKEDQYCTDHRQKKQYVCECSTTTHLCAVCLKTHREVCSRKCRLVSQFKSEYFTLMLSKLEHITDCKLHLQSVLQNYTKHFEAQKKLYECTRQGIESMFNSLGKLVDFKKNEALAAVDDYWKKCERVYERQAESGRIQDRLYDDFGRLVQRMSAQMVGLEYLDRHVVRKSVEYEAFSFRITNLDNVEKEIMAINFSLRKWEAQFSPNSNITVNSATQTNNSNNNLSNNILHRQRKSSVSNLDQGNPQILTQLNEQPLLPRPMKLVPSSNQIQYQFLHLPYQKSEYEIEFGVGFKSKGQEVFKRVKAGENGKGIIKGLNAGTTYRVRMRVCNGNWGPIYQTTTLNTQCFLVSPNTAFAKADVKNHTIYFLRPGTLYANNPIEFGTHSWEIRIIVDKNSHSQLDTACISVGVSNKAKKPVFVGSTVNYGYQRENIKMRVTVDIENMKMAILNEKAGEENYQNLPQGPIFPSINNKGNSTVQVMYLFD